MILKGSIHTLQKTFFSILETNRLMLFRDIIAFYCEYRTKRRHSLCQTEDFVRVQTAVAKCSCELTQCSSLSVCQCVRTEQCASRQTNFREISYLGVFIDIYWHISILVKLDKSNLPFKSTYSYDHIVPRSFCVVEAVCVLCEVSTSWGRRKSLRSEHNNRALSIVNLTVYQKSVIIFRWDKKKAYIVLCKSWEDKQSRI
jgi:hypothetical protein